MPWAKCFWQNKHKQGLRWSVIYFYRRLFASQTATFQEHDMENVFRMRVGKNAHNCKLPPHDLFVLCQEPSVERRDLTYAKYTLLSSKRGCFELRKDVGNGALSEMPERYSPLTGELICDSLLKYYQHWAAVYHTETQ